MDDCVLRCRWCGAIFYNREKLNEHEHIHRQTDNIGNTCSPINVNDSVKDNYANSSHSIQEDFKCNNCPKSFTRRDALLRHKKSCKGADYPKNNALTYVCSKCSKGFERMDAKKRHEKTCEGSNHVCTKCNKRCSTAHGLRRHLEWHQQAPKCRPERGEKRKTNSHTPPPTKKRKTEKPLDKNPKAGPSQYRCRQCPDTFGNRRDLYLHRMRHHCQTGGALHPQPFDDNSVPWQRDDGSIDEEFRDVYEANSPLILQRHRAGPILSLYNYPVNNGVTVDQLMGYVNNIYQQQQHAFRINLTFGSILQNRETGEYRYFIPYSNNGVLERFLFISRRTDLRRLQLRLNKLDITNELLRQRPDTKWIPVLVTNVQFYVYSTHYPVGQGNLPDYLLRKDSIYPLVINQQNVKVYKDNLCLFRCLALHRGHEIKSLERPSNEFYQEWVNFTESEKSFHGVCFEEFPDFENLFKINLEVYSLEEDGFARSVYKSIGSQETTMYVNLYENHVSYIRDFSMYAQKYQCQTCDRHFKQPSDLHKHQRNCSNQTKFVYPGGFHRAQDSLFEKLDQFNINVPQDERYFPWFVCYDFEAMLQKVSDKPTEFLQWSQKHVPISVSMCSNIEGHTEPVCIVEPNQEQLVKKMVTHLQEIAGDVLELAEEKWGWVLEAIDKKIEEDQSSQDIRTDDDDDDEDDEIDDDDGDDDDKTDKKKNKHPLKKLYSQFEGYMMQLPVLGFNSAKYDINLIKQCLPKYLDMHETNGTFVVKNNNAYTCISTPDLKFLDISQFLAAGSSYVSFLKAYHVEETKGFFPYEWMDDILKLDETNLPTHEAFYSSLKDANISQKDYIYCQKVWTDNAMSTVRDFLKWYNNLDVGPFVVAVERFQKFYFDKDIDVFKTAISVPGIARQLLFRSAKEQNANFALFDTYNADLYQTIKQNIVGGPSIIFTRHHRANVTRIRGGKRCGSILGFDANALYLQSIGKHMPVGPFIRRHAHNSFRAEVRDKFMAAYYWMDWLKETSGTQIQHKLNYGSEVRIGPYPVDGFSPANHPHEKATCYQFQGCWWHGHLCEVTKGVKDKKWRASRQQKLDKTQDITLYLKQQGYNVVEMWECQFRNYCRTNPKIYTFIDSMRPDFFQKHKGQQINENQILEGVVNQDIFGMIEVDIEVPVDWPSYFQHPSLTPYEYFQEMSPLFCTTDIPFEAMGDHMQQHVEQHNLTKVPRRLLVGGMKGRQFLLATPLLAWYLNHGMVVTRIYQVVEFQQQRCFSNFVQEVSNARRQGDINPETGIIADTSKVIGNSSYGSLIMDKTKHRDIKYVQGENETCMKINEPRFRKLECLDNEDQFYEVEMAKTKIKLDLPIQLGFFILQYAKLRMLEFYYDFMDVYVDRKDFEYCEMDTDSAYMAISGSCFDDVIKPDMKEKYRHGLKGFCGDATIEADDMEHWFPRTCCQKHEKYDKRTPGLFKLEYQGDEMIGLCSKTYIVRKKMIKKPSSARLMAYKLLRRSLKVKPKVCPYKSITMNDYKFSSKGISKRTVKAPMTKFRRVLRTAYPQIEKNRGFRVRNNTIFTYSQIKRGFSYFYCKRKVLKDGIHTVPLDITLCPIPKTEEISDHELIDLLANNFED